MSTCSSLTKRGTRCPWKAGASGLCMAHDPAQRDELRQRRAAAGAKGRAAQARARVERQVTACSLRSVDDLFPVLERALVLVLNSAAEAVDVSREVRGIVSAAAELLKANSLAEENAELRRILLERHPELKKHLQAVR